MFNLIGNLGNKRDDYGVSDLLAQVSKRSESISAEDREEINAMSRRLRQHRSNEHTPSQTPDNSHHGMNNSRRGLGREVIKKDELLRGFSNLLLSPTKRNPDVHGASPPTSPSRLDSCVSGREMLRDFASPTTSPDTSESSEEEARVIEPVVVLETEYKP